MRNRIWNYLLHDFSKAVVGMNSAAIQGIDRISLTVPLNHMKVASPLITPISKESRAAAYSTPSNLSVAESEKE